MSTHTPSHPTPTKIPHTHTHPFRFTCTSVHMSTRTYALAHAHIIVTSFPSICVYESCLCREQLRVRVLCACPYVQVFRYADIHAFEMTTSIPPQNTSHHLYAHSHWEWYVELCALCCVCAFCAASKASIPAPEGACPQSRRSPG